MEVMEMTRTKRLVTALTTAAILSWAAAALPSDAEAGWKHLAACASMAANSGKWLCRFGPHWCAGGLLGGCIVGVVMIELDHD